MKKGSPNIELPDFMAEKLAQGLTDHEKRGLDDLKRTLYQKRGGEIIKRIREVK